MARIEKVTPYSLLLDAKNSLTANVVPPNGDGKICEEARVEMKELSSDSYLFPKNECIHNYFQLLKWKIIF